MHCRVTAAQRRSAGMHPSYAATRPVRWLVLLLLGSIRPARAQSSNCCEQCKLNYVYIGGVKQGVNCYGQVCSTYCVSGYAYCANCPAGQYRRWTNCESCVTCPTGKYSISTHVCNICEAGYYCVDGFKYACDAGMYTAGAGSASCAYCGTGMYAVPIGSPGTGCATCEPGYSCWYGIRTACNAGEFRAESGAENCFYCDYQTYQPNQGQPRCLSCTTCAAGYMVSRGSCDQYGSTFDRECAICAAGTYSNTNNAASCTACPDGQYQNIAGQSTCKPFTVCRPGQKTVTVGDKTRDYVCENCVSPWTTTSGAQTACTDCVKGMYKLGSSPGSCVACTCGGSGETFINCPAGSNANSCSYCTGTQPSSYCPTGMQPSLTCDGTQTEDTTCVACPAGQHKPIANSRSCVYCTAGYYKEGPPSTASCTACSNKPPNSVYINWPGLVPQPITPTCPW